MFIKYSKPFIVLFVFPLSLFCQNNHGFAFDNYAGIYGAISNPANSVESKHRIHINALSYNRWNVSDYGSVDLLNIEQNPNGFNGIDFEENTDKPKTDNLMVSNSDVLLPSVIWGFHEKHAVGLLLRSRAYTDYNGFDGNFWAQLNGSGVEGQNIGPSNFNHTVHHWSEIGVNYALVVFKTNYHFLKFGGTIKFLSGNGGVELRGKINENDLGAININSADISYLNSFSENVDPFADSNTTLFASSAFDFQMNGSGIGGDIGLVYEWRPRETNRVGVRNSSIAVNTYKIKISAAVLDIGSVNYKGENDDILLRNFVPSSTIVKPTSVQELFTSLNTNNGEQNPQERGNVTFALPRSLNIGIDYIIFNDKNYYLNLSYIKGLTSTKDEYANTRLDLITLTPRFETMDFSAFLPISYEATTGIYAGLGIRYKYVTVGCAALNTFVSNKPLNHIYFGLSLPILEEVFR